MFRKGKKRHSSSSSQSSEISTKSKSVDSSLGGLSRSSTVASLDTDSTKSSGQSNSNSDTCAEFRVKYVGAIEKLKYNESKNLEGPLDLINYIDVAQAFVCFPPKQDGKLPFVPGEEEFIMGVSKYGIKISTSDQYIFLLWDLFPSNKSFFTNCNQQLKMKAFHWKKDLFEKRFPFSFK
ncbi:integrin beta-1-binding protein 1 isoform X3 [Apteryx rowi]|uniref:integrin beta-1-binding protein 1 isoform X3 n=1 Tax=Apteryx rowi TaxID=308060 RepID=UPI000E1CE1AA|nr:integrin beta-1-binding protein 1 isoform X3 [Apteryx rowi]